MLNHQETENTRLGGAMLKMVQLSFKKPRIQKKVNKSQINVYLPKKSPILMKIKSGTEDQESPIQWIPKAKTFVGIFNTQNVLYLYQSNWENIHCENYSCLNNIRCVWNFTDLWIKVHLFPPGQYPDRSVLSDLCNSRDPQQAYKLTLLTTLKWCIL